MNGELLAKCSCAHCGNEIEFPVEAAGAQVECPHCGRPTELNLLALPAAESTRPSAADLVAAFGGPVARTRVSPFYQTGLVLVTLMMILLPLACLALFAAAGQAAWVLFTVFSMSATSHGQRKFNSAEASSATRCRSPSEVGSLTEIPARVLAPATPPSLGCACLMSTR
jgi:hypothetical protein